MSLIGNIEQFRLSHVLKRIEAREKTGLLVVKQDQHWVEFYFRNGRLLCVGPVRTKATLVERLVRDGMLTSQALLDIRLSLGDEEQSETRAALALMENGYVSRELLREWAIRKTGDVLGVVLSWGAGEIYFEEGTLPPSDRLLVSMSVASIIDSRPQESAQPVRSSTAPLSSHSPRITVALDSSHIPAQRVSETPESVPPVTPMKPMKPKAPSPDVARVPTLMGAAQFWGDAKPPTAENLFAPPAQEKKEEPVTHKSNVTDGGFLSAASLIDGVFSPDSLPATESLSPVFTGTGATSGNASGMFHAPDTEDFSTVAENNFGSDISFAGLTGGAPETPAPVMPSIVAVPVRNPHPPRRVDTSFMQPDMVLCPADLSLYREQNPHIQITPDQWRLLLCVDGRTSLQVACQVLGYPPEAVCQLAGELIAEGLVQVVHPQQVAPEPAPIASEQAVAALAGGYVAPGYAAAPVAPWAGAGPVLSTSDVAAHQQSMFPFETESQWGNGGNGATFIPGRGWVTTPQPLQPLQAASVPAAPGYTYAPQYS